MTNHDEPERGIVATRNSSARASAAGGGGGGGFAPLKADDDGAAPLFTGSASDADPDDNRLRDSEGWALRNASMDGLSMVGERIGDDGGPMFTGSVEDGNGNNAPLFAGSSGSGDGGAAGGGRLEVRWSRERDVTDGRRETGDGLVCVCVCACACVCVCACVRAYVYRARVRVPQSTARTRR